MNKKNLLIIFAVTGFAAYAPRTFGSFLAKQEVTSPHAQIRLLIDDKQALIYELGKLRAEEGRLTLLTRTLKKGASPSDKAQLEPLVRKLDTAIKKSVKKAAEIAGIEAQSAKLIKQLKES